MRSIIGTRHSALGALMVAAALGACASTQSPAELSQAHGIYQSLSAAGADQRVSGEMLRAREAIADADNAVARHQNQDYVNGLSHIALRQTQTADAANKRTLARAAADSLHTARLNRLLSLTQAQRDQLASQNQLSQDEIARLRERNALVTQRAESLQVTAQSESQRAEMERMRADSLRREAEAANARLNSALTQLRTLVVEITNLKETTRGLVISLSDILFDVDKATLKPGAAQNIQRIAAILKQYPDHQISVEGHTDSTGTDAHNDRLSQDRANSVRDALIAGGIDSTKITAKGFGRRQPVTTNASAAGRQQNRRVEVVVLGAGTGADAAAKGDTTRMQDSTKKPPE